MIFSGDPYLEEQLHIEEVLAEALERLRLRGTWKLWQCQLDKTEFHDAEAFRQHIVV
jgi:hypothetical protein